MKNHGGINHDILIGLLEACVEYEEESLEKSNIAPSRFQIQFMHARRTQLKRLKSKTEGHFILSRRQIVLDAN